MMMVGLMLKFAEQTLNPLDIWALGGTWITKIVESCFFRRYQSRTSSEDFKDCSFKLKKKH